MATNCVLSAPSKKELENLINAFYFSNNYSINESNMTVEHKIRGQLHGYVVKRTKDGRWQFRKESK